MRTFLVTAFVLLVLAPHASAQRIDRKLKKSIQSLASDWFEARPRSCFDDWDEAIRRELLERADAIDAFPEASLEQVEELLWKELHEQAAEWEDVLKTPYGTATWIREGEGGSEQGLVIGLHGGGAGAGEASEAATNWTAKDHLGLYPQGIRLVDDTWNTVHGERFVLSLIEHAKARFEVDPDRVYVMGFSMGSTGSWFMAGRHPDLFAGAVPGHGVFMADPRSQLARKEDVRAIQHGLLPNVRDLAVWFYTGTDDTNCMPGTFLFAWDVLQRLREADPGGFENVRFTLHEGLAHEFAPGEPEAGIRWVTEHHRDPLPNKIVWEYASEPFPLPEPSERTTRIVKRWYYWLHCREPKDRMKVTAIREGNTFRLTIDRASPSAFTILLNPSMIDVEQPVEVLLDGERVYHGSPKPTFTTVLRSLDARLDRKLVFDREIELR